MRRDRLTIVVTSLTLTAAALVPASAGANSLLSGYGGPGEGNQAILGSTLLNGPSGGGGSAPSGSALGGERAGEPAGAAATGLAHTARPTTRRQPDRAPGGASTRTAPGSAQTSRLTASQGHVAAPQVPVVPGSELLYILLALGLLALTGTLTRRLARPAG